MTGSNWAEGPEWDEFVAYQQAHTVKAMQESAYVMSLVPRKDQVDIKFAVELGMAIMLDKPIIAIALPGADIPPALRKVATGIIVADLDTEAGSRDVARQLKKIMDRL